MKGQSQAGGWTRWVALSAQLMVAMVWHLSAAEKIDPLAFPTARQIHLGSVPVRVLPANFQKVKSPMAGRLFIRAGAGGGRVAEGDIWAEFEPERLRMEREALDLAERLLEEKEKPGFRLEQSEARVQLENRLADMERQQAMLAKILEEPELAELYLQEEGQDGGDTATIEAMGARLAGQVDVMRETLEYVGTPRQADLELKILELRMRQQLMDLERREQESRLRMPFTGEIQWQFAIPENHVETGIQVDAGMEIASLLDYGRLQVRMVMRRVDWRILPVETLHLRFKVSTIARPLEARFVKRSTAEVLGREELVYDFQFEAEDVEFARPLVGGTLMAELRADLGREARLVPKMELVLAAPETFREHGWVDAIPKLAPRWRTHTIGQNELALVPTDSSANHGEP
jgi:hypothetical protein